MDSSDYTERLSIRDYILVFLLLAVSGNPIIITTSKWSVILLMLLCLIVCFINRIPILANKVAKVIGGFCILFVLQFYYLESVSIEADISQLIRVYCGFLVATIVGLSFREVYLRVMTFICIVSLLGFLLNITIGQLPGLSFGRYTTLGLYNYITRSIHGSGVRNCGMFWEPGAFQGYILLSFLFFIDNFKSFYYYHKRSFYILLVSLLTTQSTTGYVVFAVFLIAIIYQRINNRILQIIAIGLFLLAGYYSFTKIDFVGQKILSEYDSMTSMEEGDVSWTRLGSMQIDIWNIQRHPLIGNGFLMSQKYGDIGDRMEGAGNGFSGAINTLGIPAILLYLILLYFNSPAKLPILRFAYVLIIVLLLNGEYFLNYPLFWSLLFIKFPFIEESYGRADRGIDDSSQPL